MKPPLALSLVLLAAQAASAQSDSALTVRQQIVGGTPVPSAGPIARATVGVLSGVGGNAMEACSATLIAPQWIVLAGHCVTANPDAMTGTASPSTVLVVFGNSSISAGSSRPASAPTRQADRVVIHPQFAHRAGIYGPQRNDIALVHFRSAAPSNFAPARFLQERDAPVAVGSPATLAGYGTTRAGRTQSDFRLMSFDTFVTQMPADSTVVELRPKKDHPGGNCQGDSGGPAFYKDANNGYVLWGVASAAVVDCKTAGQYMDARRYRDWIRGTLGADAGPAPVVLRPPVASAPAPTINTVRNAIANGLNQVGATSSQPR